ncbi:MAG TPA: tetratricopeptide repeat protein [Bryobacteraceae bacterium]|nr:tetratricopeptide repeat protein [Bryobacteraceae bacterium]
MGCRTWIWAGLLLAAVVEASGQNPGQSEIDKSAERVVFLTGNVMLDDGSPPADMVGIEKVCDGRASFAAWTDEKGHFGFKVSASGSDTVTGDASQTATQRSDELNKAINATSTQYSMPITQALRNCELRAVLPGYRSENVILAIKSTMDDARVGTIILHPLSRASSLVVSATTLQAPPNARKAYGKGLEAMRAQKWDAAASEFGKAVKTYPNFAVAWYQLGLARQSRNDAAGAIEAWKEAQKSDPRYVKPYENLTVAADHRGDWAESEKYSHLWIELDPEDFPGAYLFNAIADARLNKPEEAERAAREGLRLDKDQKIPRLTYVLGLLLMDKKAYAESARCFRKYLELAPNANDAANVRQLLPKLDELAGNPQRQ